MDRETLLLRQEEWRQIRNLEKEVNQLFIHNRGWLFTFSFSQAEMDYHTWIQNKRQERRDEICLIRQRRREAYVTYRSNLIFGWFWFSILEKLSDLGISLTVAFASHPIYQPIQRLERFGGLFTCTYWRGGILEAETIDAKRWRFFRETNLKWGLYDSSDIQSGKPFNLSLTSVWRGLDWLFSKAVKRVGFYTDSVFYKTRSIVPAYFSYSITMNARLRRISQSSNLSGPRYS